MKKGWIMLSSAILTLGLAGCGGNDNAGDNNNGQKVQNQDRPRILNDDRNERTLRISDRAERQVEKMDEVNDARVIISNNNAYVTVRLNGKNNNGNANNNGNNGNRAGAGTAGTRAGAGTGAGTAGTGAGAGTYGTGTGTGMAAGNNNADNNGNARVNDTLDGNGGDFVDNGTVNQDGNGRNGSDGMIDGKGDAGKGNRQNAGGNNGNGGDTNIFGAGNGNGNNNGANGNNGGDNVDGDTEYSEVSNAFEQRIADQVRKADKRIHKVFVSMDTDLYDRMGTYADDIRTNRDRDGLFDDFNADMNDFFGRNNDNNR